MAHIVGVPKRDPCQKCSLPVFLAERLMIGKNVYHRTCLRCARCNSQLTPGSFYETEVDGEYCCETCPDEEKKLDVATSSKDSKSDSLGPTSIAERLSFFENDGTKVLQKSLSDEEKSQSLKKFTEAQLQSVYKPNSALNSFMNRHLSDAVDSVSHNSSRRSSNSSTGSSTSNVTDDDPSEEPPELPKSLPPSSLEVDISGTPSLQPSEASLESSTVESNVNVDLKSQDVHISSAKIENIENTHTEQREPPAEPLEQQKDTSAPPCNDLTLSINVTKDSSEDDDQMRTKRDPTSVERCKISATTDAEHPVGGSPSTNRTSMVRARLHQFEVIANKSQDSSISSLSKNRLSDRSKANRTSIDESSQSLETEVPKIVCESDESQHSSTEISPTIDLVAINQEEDASYTFTEDKQEEVVLGNDQQENSHVTAEISPPIDNASVEEEIVHTHLSVDKASTSALPSAEVLNDSSTAEKPVADSVPESIVMHEAVESPQKNKSALHQIAGTESPKQETKDNDYPEDLNPFKSDDEEDLSLQAPILVKEKRKSLNPFESSDEECENETKMKPPRPPPPKKISTNPFGSESEDEELSMASSVNNSSGTPRRTPIPTPRNCKSTSQSVTPEPTPRATRQSYDTPFKNTSDYYGSTSSLSATGSAAKTSLDQFHRESDVRGSGRSLASSSGSAGGITKSRKKKAPAPPPPAVSKISKELFSPTDQESKKSSPGSSTATTPTPQRKKRPAPAPPSATKGADNRQDGSSLSSLEPMINNTVTIQEEKKEDMPPAQIEKLCDEEKALLESSTKISSNESLSAKLDQGDEQTKAKRRLIALDVSLVEDANSSEDLKPKEEDNVIYRRTLVPPVLDDSPVSPSSDTCESHDRQLEKMKDNKEAKNRNRQSQISLPAEENDPLYNKSIHGKWKRRKGPAPALPIPPKKVLQMLPLQEIRHELEIIEVQQQGLEKQGVMLEKMIRERCEGPTGADITDGKPSPPNSKEVEDLILQLFELVNEKNELFRRQAELMYLRRQHRLEQEQADLEYEIRVLMAQPERNKTDSDKAREEALIARLVEVVQLRNEVVECLEMDRLREAEEDLSIKQQLEIHSAKRDEELSKQTPTKLSKKEKKKQKEHKKIGKSKKFDADKDADESEISAEKQKTKKKKKKFLF